MKNKNSEKQTKEKGNTMTLSKLYKFRPLANCNDFCRIKDIIENGFYCCDFLKFNDMNEGVFSINRKNEGITLDLKQKYKICSFSGQKALNSQLMWGHYANAGMGVAIEIEVVLDPSDIEEVSYDNEAPDSNKIIEILKRKSKVWSYENEYRHFSNEDTEDKVLKDKITNIYFGRPYKKLKNYEKIEEKHEKLKEYSEYKLKLEKFLKDNFKNISYDDHKFNF